MEPTPKRKRKYVPTPKRDRYFYNIKKEYRVVLEKIQKQDNMDEPILVILKSRLTLLIEKLIQKDCQRDEGILMNKMLKLEADLTIAAYLLRSTGFRYVIPKPESTWPGNKIKEKL